MHQKAAVRPTGCTNHTEREQPRNARVRTGTLIQAAVCALSCVALSLRQGEAQTHSVDPAFNAAVTGSYVQSVAVYPDGSILAGGNFTRANGVVRNHVARFNTDGTLDSTFDPGTGANAEVLAVAIQSDGKALIGGAFTTVNRVARSRIARLNPDGSVDTTFVVGAGADNPVRAIRIQDDGKILVAGQFSKFDGLPRNCIARLNTDGSVDTSFVPGKVGGYLFANTIAICPDGKILLGGDFATYDGQLCASIVRLNSDGSRDLAFQPGKGTTPDNPIISLILQPDGKVVIAGSFYTYQGVPRINIARLHRDGTLDTDFDAGKNISGGLYNMIQSVAAMPNGGILVAGSLRSNLVLLNPNGSINTNFTTKVDSPLRCLAPMPDGRIVLGGEFNRVDGATHNRIARLNLSSPSRKVAIMGWGRAKDTFQCRIQTGAPGALLEASTDLVHWQPVFTNSPLSVVETFDHVTAADSPCCFYRLR